MFRCGGTHQADNQERKLEERHHELKVIRLHGALNTRSSAKGMLDAKSAMLWIIAGDNLYYVKYDNGSAD